MKRTKSMVYRETEESRELFLYATNTGEIYPQTCNIIRNLAKKYAKGVYNADKAIDAFYPLATLASNIYLKWYGYSFTVQDRFTAAVDMRDYYFENVVNNDV